MSAKINDNVASIEAKRKSSSNENAKSENPKNEIKKNNGVPKIKKIGYQWRRKECVIRQLGKPQKSKSENWLKETEYQAIS